MDSELPRLRAPTAAPPSYLLRLSPCLLVLKQSCSHALWPENAAQEPAQTSISQQGNAIVKSITNKRLPLYVMVLTVCLIVVLSTMLRLAVRKSSVRLCQHHSAEEQLKIVANSRAVKTVQGAAVSARSAF